MKIRKFFTALRTLTSVNLCFLMLGLSSCTVIHSLEPVAQEGQNIISIAGTKAIESNKSAKVIISPESNKIQKPSGAPGTLLFNMVLQNGSSQPVRFSPNNIRATYTHPDDKETHPIKILGHEELEASAARAAASSSSSMGIASALGGAIAPSLSGNADMAMISELAIQSAEANASSAAAVSAMNADLMARSSKYLGNMTVPPKAIADGAVKMLLPYYIKDGGKVQIGILIGNEVHNFEYVIKHIRTY